LPAILLSDSAQQLMCDIFGNANLFDDLPAVSTRVVSWGVDAQPVALPHSAVVVSEHELLRRLAVPADTIEPAANVRWTVVGTSQSAGGHTFGSRTAAAMAAELRDDAEPNACWIESLDRGWLFLISTAPRAGWLLAVGDLMPNPLATSRLLANKIAHLDTSEGRFPAAPRIAAPLCGRGWLGCGSAAISFDPLCGDGTAHAIREGILASAVIQAESDGEDVEALLSHYRARLTAALQRHLTLCLSYYRTGGAGPWWVDQMNALPDGIAWCDVEIGDHEYCYRLEGLRLKPLCAAKSGMGPAL
jgi:hypothetical protein